MMTDGFSSAQLAGQDETAAGRKPNPYDGMITADGPSESQQWLLPSVRGCLSSPSFMGPALQIRRSLR